MAQKGKDKGVWLSHFLIFGVPVAVIASMVVLPLLTHAASSCITTKLSRGSTGNCVRYAQTLTNYALGAVNISDGQFGPNTASSVSAVQAKYGLIKTGIVDSGTWKAICDPHAVPTPANFPIAEAKAAGCAVKVTLCTTVMYGQGSTGDCIKYMQALLNYANDMSKAIDGKYKQDTTSDVMSAQTKYKLKSSGVVDAATWRALCDPHMNPVPVTFPLYEARTAGCSVPANLTFTSSRQIAQQILDNKNITFYTSHRRDAVVHIAQTGKSRVCGGVDVSPKILNAILSIGKKYKIVVNSIVDGHESIDGCTRAFHPKGKAVDIYGVTSLDGKTTTGTVIPRSSSKAKFALSTANESMLKKFYVDMGTIIAKTGGGLGQVQCFNGTAPAKVKGTFYFEDACDHIHVDVGTR